MGCTPSAHQNSIEPQTILNHDVSYIPFITETDDPEFSMCDSPSIRSGRNRLQYEGGKDQLNEDIEAYYRKVDYQNNYSGYIVLRFLINCRGDIGRYRVASLGPDLRSQKAPKELLSHSLAMIDYIDHWTKSQAYGDGTEYSKFINIKFDNGQIQHVLL